MSDLTPTACLRDFIPNAETAADHGRSSSSNNVSYYYLLNFTALASKSSVNPDVYGEASPTVFEKGDTVEITLNDLSRET